MDHATFPVTQWHLLASTSPSLAQAWLHGADSSMLIERLSTVGFPVSTGCQHTVGQSSCCVLIFLSCFNLNGGKRLGVWLHRPSCPLLSRLFPMPGCFMASATLLWWLQKSTWHHVNNAFPFPNTHGMCRSCCNRICGCCCDSTLSNRTHVPFHRRGCTCLLPISLTSAVSLCGAE